MSSCAWCGAAAPLGVPLLCAAVLSSLIQMMIHRWFIILHSTYAFASLFFSALLLASLFFFQEPLLTPYIFILWCSFSTPYLQFWNPKCPGNWDFFYCLVGWLAGWVLLIFQGNSLDLNVVRGKTGPDLMRGCLETLFLQPSVHIRTVHGSPFCVYFRVLPPVPWSWEGESAKYTVNSIPPFYNLKNALDFQNTHMAQEVQRGNWALYFLSPHPFLGDQLCLKTFYLCLETFLSVSLLLNWAWTALRPSYPLCSN